MPDQLRRHEFREWWSLLAPVVAAFLAWGVTWGTLQQTVSEHDRRIVSIEARLGPVEATSIKLDVLLSVLRAQLDQLSAQERAHFEALADRLDDTNDRQRQQPPTPRAGR